MRDISLPQSSMFEVTAQRYQLIVNAFLGRSVILFFLMVVCVTAVSVLFWHLLLGYIQFEIWEQPIQDNIIDHFLLNLLEMDNLPSRYFGLANIGLLFADSIGMALPALITIALSTHWIGRQMIKSQYPLMWLVVSAMAAVLLALVPVLLGFVFSMAYYQDQNMWLSEFFVSSRENGVYFKSCSAITLGSLTPWFVWFSLLISTAGVRLGVYGVRLVNQICIALVGSGAAQRSKQELAIDQALEQERLASSSRDLASPGLKSLLSAALMRFFGYDFFISYTRQGGYKYARALSEKLKEGHFSCFIDEINMLPGERWRRSVFKALRRSAVLLVVANHEALEQDSIFHEIQAFGPMNRPIMPVVFDDSLSDLPREHRLWTFLEQRLRCEEPGGLKALQMGEPSYEVINFCDKSFNGVRIHRVRQWVLGSLATIFFALAVVAGIQYYRQYQASIALKTQLIASSSINALTPKPSLAFLLAKRANQQGNPHTMTSLRAMAEVLERWPHLKCIQRITYNRLLATSPWLDRGFSAVGTSYARTFPSLCEPEQFQAIEHRDRDDYRSIHMESGDYVAKGDYFLLGGYNGAVYKLSRDARNLTMLRKLSKYPIKRLVAIPNNPKYFLYAAEPEFSKKAPEICLVRSDTWHKQCGIPSGLKTVNQMAFSGRSQSLFLLSRGRMWRIQLDLKEQASHRELSGWTEFEPGQQSTDHFTLAAGAPLMAISDDNQYLVLDLYSGQKFPSKPVPNAYISALGFSSKGNLIAIGVEGMTLKEPNRVLLIQTNTGEVLHEYPMLDSVAASKIEFAKEDKRLIVVSHEGLAAVWNLEPMASHANKLPGRLLGVAPRFGGGFDLLVEGRETRCDGCKNVRLTTLPTNSSKKIHDFVTSPTEDIRFLSMGSDVFVSISGEDWTRIELSNQGKAVTRLSPYGNEVWLFRSDLKMARYQVRKKHFTQDWLDSPRTETRRAGSGNLSKFDYENYSEISAVAVPNESDIRILTLMDGSLVRSSRTLSQDLHLIPPHRSLTYGFTKTSTTNEQVSLAISSSGRYLAAIYDGWMRNDSLAVFDLHEDFKIVFEDSLDANPKGIALSRQGHMLALLTIARNMPVEKADAVRLRILDTGSLNRLMPDQIVPGRNTENCKPYLVFDSVNQQLFISRCGRDYTLRPFSVEVMREDIQRKVPFDFTPDQSAYYGVPWKPLPERP